MVVRSVALLAFALLLAGCTDRIGSEGVSMDAQPVTTPSLLPFSEHGSIARVARFCPAVTCVDAPEESSDRFFPIEFEGTLGAVNLTLTWAATSEFTNTLRIGISYGPEQGREFQSVDGEAPLQLSLDELAIPDTENVQVFVWMPSSTPTLESYVAVSQDFQIDGELWFIPAS